MASALARRDRAREHYQSVVHFQPIQPAMFDTPLLYTPAFDSKQCIEYRPNSLESTLPSNVIGELDVETSFNLVNPTLYTAPAVPVEIPVEDLELLPQSFVDRDPSLRKLVSSKDSKRKAIGWLRYTEYTEMLDPYKARRQLLRKRQATLLEQPRPQVQSEFVEPGDGDETMAAGVERTFRMAKELDEEWEAYLAAPEMTRRRLVHPNPAKRDARPIHYRHVFPNFTGWGNDYFSVHFLDGNPIPVERLVPPNTDFYALSPSEQQQLLESSQDHQDALLLHLMNDDADVISYLLKRKRGDDESDDAADESHAPGKRLRGGEYERAADYQLLQTETQRREYVFALDETACKYQPLESCVSMRRRPAHRGRDRRGETYVVEPLPLTDEQQKHRQEKENELYETMVKAEDEVIGAAGE